MALPGKFNTGEHPYPNLFPPRIEDDVNALFDIIKKDREELNSSRPSLHTTTLKTTIEDDDFDNFEHTFQQTSKRIQNRFKQIKTVLASVETTKKTDQDQQVLRGFIKPKENNKPDPLLSVNSFPSSHSTAPNETSFNEKETSLFTSITTIQQDQKETRDKTNLHSSNIHHLRTRFNERLRKRIDAAKDKDQQVVCGFFKPKQTYLDCPSSTSSTNDKNKLVVRRF